MSTKPRFLTDIEKRLKRNLNPDESPGIELFR